VTAVESLINDLEETSFDLGAVAVANRFQEQLPKRLVLKAQLPQDIENLAPKCLSLLVELLKEATIDLAFPRVLGDEVPEVANLGLTDPVNPAETLLQAIRVPGQVVVDHQVGALEVNPFTGGVRGDEDLHVLVMSERLLGLPALFAADPAVNGDEGLGPADESPDSIGEIIQGVAVLGEDDELPAMAVGVEHLRVVLEQPGEFIPLPVGPGLANSKRELFEVAEQFDFGPQFRDGSGGGGLVENALFGLFQLDVGSVLDVVDVVGVQRGDAGRDIKPNLVASLEKLLLAEPLLQPLASALQRLIDGFRRGRESALQDGESEADGPFSSVVFEGLGPVELFPDVAGHLSIEVGFGVREGVGHRVGDSLGEERRAVELEEMLFDKPPHHVRRVGQMHAIPEFPLEAVPIEQGHEELKVGFFPVVRGRREEQEVPGQAPE